MKKNSQEQDLVPLEFFVIKTPPTETFTIADFEFFKTTDMPKNIMLLGTEDKNNDSEDNLYLLLLVKMTRSLEISFPETTQHHLRLFCKYLNDNPIFTKGSFANEINRANTDEDFEKVTKKFVKIYEMFLDVIDLNEDFYEFEHGGLGITEDGDIIIT